jgi:putative oxidoreductase
MNKNDGGRGGPVRLRGAVAARAPALLRLLLGGFFIASGWHKIADPHGFALALYRYDLLPGTLINPVAILLPWLEVTCGAALVLIRPWHRGALCWMLAMLVPFTLAILAAMARGFDIPCGCAGFADQDTPVG